MGVFSQIIQVMDDHDLVLKPLLGDPPGLKKATRWQFSVHQVITEPSEDGKLQTLPERNETNRYKQKNSAR